MNNFEKPTPIKSPEREAQDLYLALPEAMKTDHYGLASDRSEYFSSPDEINGDKVAAPCILVNFRHGGILELHPDNTQNAEEEFKNILNASKEAENVESVELLWRAP